MELLKAFAMFLSIAMCLYLVSFSYMEGIRFFNKEEEVKGGTILFSLALGLLFAFIANSFYLST